MDISEFSRWAHEYGLVPKYLSLEKMKSIFREANVGDHSDEYRHTFDYEEFVYCVRRCVNEVMIACGDGAVPARILHLRTLLAGGEEDEPVSREMAMASTMSANLMTAYDNDNASDGVRVPVSTLWSSVREVESHLQTEEQLRAALDRLAAQAKSEVSQLERQKAAAVAALEASEDQLLELEREANGQLDELQLARDEARADAATAREECDRLRAEYDMKLKDMEEINVKALEDRDFAMNQRDEMNRLLDAANEERENAYSDARVMAKERDELILEHKLLEATWQKDMSALERKMNEAIDEREKQLATQKTEHEISMKKAEDKWEIEMNALEKKNAEALKAAEETRRTQVTDLEKQLHEAKRKSEQDARDAATKFRDAESEWSTKVRNTEQELSDSKAQTRSVEAELARTIRTAEDTKTRLETNIERLHSELQTEIERRETLQSELSKLKEDFASERHELQASIDTANRKLQAAEIENVGLKGDIDTLKSERSTLTESLNSARIECDRLYRELESCKHDVKNKVVEISSIQGTLEQTRKDKELYQKTAERTQAALQSDIHTEQTAHDNTRALLRDQQSEHQDARDEIKRLMTELQEDRRRNQQEKEATLAETRRRIGALQKEHQQVEEGLRTELKSTHSLLENKRDEVNSLTEQLATSRSREENLQLVRMSLDEKNELQKAEIQRKAMRVQELEDQINRLQQQISSLELQSEEKDATHAREIEFLKAEMQQKLRAAEDAQRASTQALTSELSRCKEQSALLKADLETANNTIEELRDANNRLRSQLQAEEAAHTRTQSDLEQTKREAGETQLRLQKSFATIEDQQAQIRRLEERLLRLEGDNRMSSLTHEQQESELQRALAAEMELNGRLAEERAHSQSLDQRRLQLEKQLQQTEGVVDTLKAELDALHITNDQLAQEARREILGLKDEMNKIKSDYDREIQRLKEKLAQLQSDRDQMESAYQFAKDELTVIKATLAEMEEGQQRTQYIVEDGGMNPTLVNRMQSEWNRVDGSLEAGDPNDPYSPKRKAFARDFRRSHTSPQEAPVDMGIPPQRQGALGHSPWRY